MTRKDFKQFASLFNITIEQHKRTCELGDECNPHDCLTSFSIAQLIHGTSNIFQDANSRFNRDKFTSACNNWYSEYKTNPFEDHYSPLTATELTNIVY
jgi:hypothetical protein